MKAEKILKISDVAELTGFSTNYLYKLTARKKIRHFKPTGKVIFFRESDVYEFLSKNEIEVE